MLFVGVGFATAAAHLGNNFTTYLIGGLIDRFQFSPLQMGAWSMVDMLAYAAAMFLIAPKVSSISPRRLALAAGALVAIAQILSAGLASYTLLLFTRIGTGIGFGLANTALNLAAGRTSHPARAISAGIALQTLLYALINIVLPMIGERYGVAGMFCALATLSAVFSLLVGALPATPAEDRNCPRVPSAAIGADGWQVLAAMALFTFGSLAIWPFIERAAHAIGLSAVSYGRIQSIATIASMLGNVALAAVNARIRGTALLILALVVCGCACGALTSVAAEFAFACALVVYNASWFVTYPLLLAIAYQVDSTGRLAVLCSAAWLLMMSLGSLATGLTAQIFGGYTLVGPLGMLICFAAVSVIWPLARRLDSTKSRVLTAGNIA
jgi:predicted MFS family arabinose efflux permease